jgi:hypothetical protein
LAKHELYKALIERMDTALTDERYFEASWYAYAILEDRLISLVHSSTPTGSTQRAPRGMEKKMRVLRDRTSVDSSLSAFFEDLQLDDWRKQRNRLMHAMAEGTLTIADVDTQGRALAEEGARLVRQYAAAARRLKKR